MKKFFVPHVAKWTLSVLGTTIVASGIVYAATITDVHTQTIAPGDTIGAGWYQSVNDRLAALSGSGSSGSANLGGSSASATSRTIGYMYNTDGYNVSSIPSFSVSCNTDEVVTSCTIQSLQFHTAGQLPTISGKSCISPTAYCLGGGTCSTTITLLATCTKW